MLALMPWKRIAMNAIMMPTGKATIATSADRMCNKNTAQMRVTRKNCSTSVADKLSTARSISEPRS